MRSVLGECAFVAELFEDTSTAHLNSAAASAAPNAPSVSIFVDHLGQKAGSVRRSLEEGQIRLVRGVFRAT